MKTLGLNHYNIRAPRPLLDALCAFYCDVVGLRIGDRPALSHFGYWLYAGNCAVLHLSEAGAGETRRANESSTFDHAAFTCTDRAGFEALLEQRAISYRVGGVPQTGQVQLFLKDPAGNGVELNFARESD